MYTGRMIDQLMVSVQRAEEHVQHELELQEQVLQMDAYSAYFYSVVPAAHKPAVA